MKIVTGYTGTPHITPNDDQGRNQGIFGTGNYILNVGNKFSASVVNANTVQIQDGEGVMQGVHFRILPGTVDTVTIQNGITGYNRIDLICARYTKDAVSGVEDVSLAVITGTPSAGAASAPSYNAGDILGGATLVDFPLWQVNLTDLTPSISEPSGIAPASGLVDIIYPVGSIYMSTASTNPSLLFGGEWEAWGSGRVPVGVDTNDTDFATAEKTGGEKTHTLTTTEMPSHTHSTLPMAAQRGHVTLTFAATGFGGSGSAAGYLISDGNSDYPSSSAGSGEAHNNIQPYITCYMWKRTA